MKINIPYGEETINIKVPDKNILGVVYPNKVNSGDEIQILADAIYNPINSKTFEEFIFNAKDLLLIVNDGKRLNPTIKILDIIYDKIKNKNIKFIIATGAHHFPTEEEFNLIFGNYYKKIKNQVFVHDSKRIEDMVYIGNSRNGTEIWLNKMIKADSLISIGAIEPHYFAGYTGGRKSFLPGIAGYKTIEQNHKYALSSKAQTLNLEDNLVHADMDDVLDIIKDKKIFSIQTVFNKEKKIHAAAAGHIKDSFYALLNKVKEIFCVKIENKADIVVSIATYPMDIDLYQSQKVLENGKMILKENGILLMVSKCKNGIGDNAFFNLLSQSNFPEEAIKKINKKYKLGYHKAARIAQISLRSKIWSVTDLKEVDLKRIFINPFHSIEEAINKAIEEKGHRAKILFLMDGGRIVPIIK